MSGFELDCGGCGGKKEDKNTLAAAAPSDPYRKTYAAAATSRWRKGKMRAAEGKQHFQVFAVKIHL